VNSYEQRQEARRQLLLSLAARLESEGNARYKHAKARFLADIKAGAV